MSWLALFGYSALAATLLPGGSEIVLAGMLIEQPESAFWLWLVATLGNTLGACVTFFMGTLLALKLKPLSLARQSHSQNQSHTQSEFQGKQGTATHNFTKHQTPFNASVQFISEAHRSTESPWCLVVIAKLGALCRRWLLFGCWLLRLAKETEFKPDCLRQSGPLWPVVAVVGIARSALPLAGLN